MAKTKKTQKETQRVLAGDSASLRKTAADMSRQMTKQTVQVTKRNVARGTKEYKRKKALKGRQNTLEERTKEDQLVNRKRIAPLSADKLNSRLDNYFRALQDPWSLQGVRCPVNYNPVPSFMITTAHTTRTATIGVAAASTTQLTLLPGHSYNIDTDAMDGVSYHAGLTRINAVNYPVGPMTLGGVNGVIGVQTSGLTAGVDVVNFDTAASTAMTFDVNLPYTALAGNGGHSRWKLVSMGITIENTTPIAERGGEIQHVIPVAAIQATGGATGMLVDYASQPTFRVTTAANEGALKLAWIPRADDLAFWHVDTATTSGVVVNAAMILWVNAPTGFPQTYAYQVVCNWELSGHSLAAVSAPTIHQPADKNVVEPVISALQFTKSHATDVINIAKAVASHAPAFVTHTSKALSYLSDVFG